MPTAAASFSEPGPPYFLTSRYATKMSQSSSALVSFASHCHQTPHAFRAHSGPLMRPFRPNSSTSSAADSAYRSAIRSPLNKYQMLPTAHTSSPQYIATHDG